MTTKAWAIEMVRYARWQNETLYGLCEDLTEEQRTEDRGLFFKSIHHTLDHMLMVERVLLDHSKTGTSENLFDVSTIMQPDYGALKAARVGFDNALEPWLDQHPDGWLDDSVTFQWGQMANSRTVPRHFFWAQMFNHGTHHRAQVTSELHRMGIDYGSTDIPFNPYSQY